MYDNEQDNLPTDSNQSETPQAESNQNHIDPTFNNGFMNFYDKERRAAPTPPPMVMSPTPPPPRRPRLAPLIVALVLVSAIAISSVGLLIGIQFRNNPASPTATVGTTATAQATVPAATSNPEATQVALNIPSGSQLTATQVFDKCNPGVVAISTETTVRNVFGQASTQASAGSGFIISQDGYIVTNHHVIDSAKKVTVILADGTKYDAAIVGSDSVSDIAVLKIDAQGLTALELGTSQNLKVGETVYALGNPLGELANTLTNGIISALDREIEIDNEDGTTNSMNLMQTNAAISPGNSGGPLINEYGQVIGVVNAKSVSSGVEGLGFAIPIDDAQVVINDIIQNGSVQRPSLNITATNFYEVRGNRQVIIEGAGVYSVIAGGAADKAGVKENDLITAIDGTAITSSDDLIKALRKYSVGDTVTLTITRDKNEITVQVVLGLPMDNTPTEDTAAQEQDPNQGYNPWDFFG